MRGFANATGWKPWARLGALLLLGGGIVWAMTPSRNYSTATQPINMNGINGTVGYLGNGGTWQSTDGTTQHAYGD